MAGEIARFVTLAPELVTRRQSATRDSADAPSADEPLRITISNEEPMYLGLSKDGRPVYEILHHDPAGVSLRHVARGISFLYEHFPPEQIGYIRNLEVRDRALTGEVEWGSNPNGDWVRRDILAGVRPWVSVGYVPLRAPEIEELEDKIIVHTRHWEPLEASSVAVPANPAVGVGRSALAAIMDVHIPEGESMKDQAMTQDAQQSDSTQAAPPPNVRAGVDYEAQLRQRNAALANVAAMARAAGFDAPLEEALAKGWSPEQFIEEINTRRQKQALANQPPAVRLSEREQKQYSLGRLLNAMVEQQSGNPRALQAAGFELEVSAEIEKRAGRPARGVWVPTHLAVDREAAMQVRASLPGAMATVASLGGAMVPTVVQPIIEILAEGSLIGRLPGVRRLDGLTANLLFPRHATSNTMAWVGENPSSALTLTQATLDSFTLSPKTGVSGTSYSRQIFVQSSGSIEQFLRDDLAQVISAGLDTAFVNGSGSTQPGGILNQTGTQLIPLGTNGGNLTWADLVATETKVLEAAAAGPSLAFVSTPGVQGYLKSNLRNAVSGAQYLMSDDGRVNGYPFVASVRVPNNLTKGTSSNCHALVFGDWSQCLVATWGDGVDVMVDPYSASLQGMVVVTASIMVDIGWRQPPAFVVIKDVLV